MSAHNVMRSCAMLALVLLAACPAERVRSLKDASAEALAHQSGAGAAKAEAKAAEAPAAADKAKAAAAGAAEGAKGGAAATAGAAAQGAGAVAAAAAADPKAALGDPKALAEKAKIEAAAAADKAKAEAAAAAERAKAEAAAAAGKPVVPKTLVLPANLKAAVNVQLRFATGSIDDPPGKAGLTALTARVMTEGGTQALDSKQLLEALFPIAAELDVRVDREQTTFTARVHKDALDKLTGILTDVVLKARWDEKEFARLREAQVNDLEKRLRQADDENLGKEALAALLYRGHPYGRPIRGHVSDLKSMSLSDVKAHAARVFTADRLTVGVSGGYPAGYAEKLAQALSALPPASAPKVAVPAQAPLKRPRFLLVEKPGASTAVSMGFPWDLSRRDPEWAAMSIARSAMGEHRQFNGRLMQRLREQRGLNYGDYAYLESFAQEGGNAATAQLGRARHQQELTVWLRPVQNDNRLFAVRAALWELAKSINAEPFSAAEVARTKGFLDGYILLFDQTDARKLGAALDDQFNGTPGFFASWRKALDAATPEAVNAAWKKRVDPAQLQIVMVGPEMKKLKEQILANGPSPIQYQKDGSGKVPEKPKELLEADKFISELPLGAVGEADVEIVPVEKLFE